jgi:hypothetical protein
LQQFRLLPSGLISPSYAATPLFPSIICKEKVLYEYYEKSGGIRRKNS